MRIVSFTEARNGLKAVLDNVINDADTTVITRRDSKDAVVMSLNRSIAQFKAAKTTQRELIDE